MSSLALLMFFGVVIGFSLKLLLLSSFVFDPTVQSVVPAQSMLEYLPDAFKLFPVLLIITGLYLARQQTYAANMQYRWSKVSYFIQSKYFYDNLLNKIGKVGLRCGTKIYLSLDKGLLEWAGPYGLFLLLRPISQSIDYTFFDRRIETSFLGILVGIIFLLLLI